MITSWREKLGIIIESIEIADAMKKIYSLAWEEAKRLSNSSKKSLSSVLMPSAGIEPAFQPSQGRVLSIERRGHLLLPLIYPPLAISTSEISIVRIILKPQILRYRLNKRFSHFFFFNVAR